MKYYKYFGERFIPSKNIEKIRKKEIDLIKTLLPHEKVEWIFDIGCGGIIPLLLAREGYKVVGIDINKEFIQRAKKEAIKLGVYKNTTLIEGDARCFQKYLKNKNYEGLFDCILLWEDVLPHLSYKEFNQILQSSRKYCKKGSYLLLSYVDAYRLLIETGYRSCIIKNLENGATSLSLHSSYNEKKGSFIRRHIIYAKNKYLDEFNLEVYIWAPSIVEFITNINNYSLIERKIIKFPLNSYNSIIDLYRSCDSYE